MSQATFARTRRTRPFPVWQRDRQPPPDTGEPERPAAPDTPNRPGTDQGFPRRPSDPGNSRWLPALLGILAVVLFIAVAVAIISNLAEDDNGEDDNGDDNGATNGDLVLETAPYTLGDRYEAQNINLRYPEGWQALEGSDGELIFVTSRDIGSPATNASTFADFSETDAAIFMEPLPGEESPEVTLQNLVEEDRAAGEPLVYGAVIPGEVGAQPAARVEVRNSAAENQPPRVILIVELEGQLYRFDGYAPTGQLEDLEALMEEMAISIEPEPLAE
jgi:hypothetical protein